MEWTNLKIQSGLKSFLFESPQKVTGFHCLGFSQLPSSGYLYRLEEKEIFVMDSVLYITVSDTCDPCPAPYHITILKKP